MSRKIIFLVWHIFWKLSQKYITVNGSSNFIIFFVVIITDRLANFLHHFWSLIHEFPCWLLAPVANIFVMWHVFLTLWYKTAGHAEKKKLCWYLSISLFIGKIVELFVFLVVFLRQHLLINRAIVFYIFLWYM